MINEHNQVVCDNDDCGHVILNDGVTYLNGYVSESSNGVRLHTDGSKEFTIRVKGVNDIEADHHFCNMYCMHSFHSKEIK